MTAQSTRKTLSRSSAPPTIGSPADRSSSASTAASGLVVLLLSVVASSCVRCGDAAFANESVGGGDWLAAAHGCASCTAVRWTHGCGFYDIGTRPWTCQLLTEITLR